MAFVHRMRRWDQLAIEITALGCIEDIQAIQLLAASASAAPAQRGRQIPLDLLVI